MAELDIGVGEEFSMGEIPEYTSEEARRIRSAHEKVEKIFEDIDGHLVEPDRVRQAYRTIAIGQHIKALVEGPEVYTLYELASVTVRHILKEFGYK